MVAKNGSMVGYSRDCELDGGATLTISVEVPPGASLEARDLSLMTQLAEFIERNCSSFEEEQ